MIMMMMVTMITSMCKQVKRAKNRSRGKGVEGLRRTPNSGHGFKKIVSEFLRV